MRFLSKEWGTFVKAHFWRGQTRKSHSSSFFGLSLLRNHMKTLATQATECPHHCIRVLCIREPNIGSCWASNEPIKCTAFISGNRGLCLWSHEFYGQDVKRNCYTSHSSVLSKEQLPKVRQTNVFKCLKFHSHINDIGFRASFTELPFGLGMSSLVRSLAFLARTCNRLQNEQIPLSLVFVQL